MVIGIMIIRNNTNKNVVNVAKTLEKLEPRNTVGNIKRKQCSSSQEIKNRHMIKQFHLAYISK